MESFINWLQNYSEDFQFVLYFSLLFLLIIAEQWMHYRKIVRKKRWLANFMMTLIAIFTMMIIPVTFISAAGYAREKHWGIFNFISINWIALAVISLLIRGFISFFTHYLMHKVPLFWRIHRVHHLDTELDVSTTVRFHPFEFLINTLVGVPVILLFGLPVWVLLLYELLDVVITLLSHSNIRLSKKIDSTLRYIIVTPELHRVHHSSHQPETDSNFSAVFPIWDIIFRTFKTKTRESTQTMQMGLQEVRDKRTANVFWLLISPFENINQKKELKK